MNYNELNKEQRAAVESDHRRILCLAGAGTGKTKTMVTRAARLIEEGVDPWNILILTFTNAAAREMKERLIKLVGDKGEQVWASTFHSWAVKEIRRYGAAYGYTPGFTIYDGEDTLSIVTSIIEDMQYKMKPDDVVKAMEKNNVYRVPIPAGDIERTVDEYRFRCRRQNAIDIDSLITTLQSLLENDTINYILHNQYKYVFVDEFQDTDPRQMRLLYTLNPENLFVVGDDFQSIYGFRGADVSIIMGLSQDPDWQTIKLEENYRSTRQIVDAANALIKHNHQTEKELKAHRNGPAIELITKDTMEDEMDWIAGKCMRIGYDTGFFYNTAILARTNKQVNAIASRLSAMDVPYEIRQKTQDVLKTIEAKKLFAWMAAALNPQDDESVKAIINWPEQTVSRKRMLDVEMFQLENGCSLLTALEAKGEAQKIVNTIHDLHDIYIPAATTMHDAIIQQTGIVWWNREQGLENRNQRIKEIRDTIVEWEMKREELGEDITPESWLEHYKMRLIEAPANLSEELDAVQLMTAHGSKGLEFDTVIIAGMNEKSFPLTRGDIEEERRLCYVAMTRAKERLYLTRSTMRTVWGDHVEEAEPSRFLEEM